MNAIIDATAKAYTVGHNTIDAGNATFRAIFDPLGESASATLTAGSLGLLGVGVTGSTATARRLAIASRVDFTLILQNFLLSTSLSMWRPGAAPVRHHAGSTARMNE